VLGYETFAWIGKQGDLIVNFFKGEKGTRWRFGGGPKRQQKDFKVQGKEGSREKEAFVKKCPGIRTTGKGAITKEGYERRYSTFIGDKSHH